MRRRRGIRFEWPPGLDRFNEADWPPPESGEDPGASGLPANSEIPNCQHRAASTEAWLAEVIPDDPGLAAAWRTTFAYKRWAKARENFVGEDSPLHVELWISHVQREREFVQLYVARRDGRMGREWHNGDQAAAGSGDPD